MRCLIVGGMKRDDAIIGVERPVDGHVGHSFACQIVGELLGAKRSFFESLYSLLSVADEYNVYLHDLGQESDCMGPILGL